MSNRVKKSLLNAEVNLIFYFLTLFLVFYSRKVFLNHLGADFIGLSGTLSNILGYLNLAELGIGAAISYNLYKPLQEKDREKIAEIVSLFGYFYSVIGFVIFGFGLVISLFFPLIFVSSNVGLGIVYYTFFSILSSSLIGYFINYREILLNADQKKYLVTAYYQSAGLVKTIIQIIVAYFSSNPFYWVTIEFLFSIISCIILNWRINKEYPWLVTNKRKGKLLVKEFNGIIVTIKQIFIHKIKDFILTRSDQLFVFCFVSLKMVAYYGNYTIIISRFGNLFSAVLDSIQASVGNLIAEGDKNKVMKVFWELMTVRHFVTCIICFGVYHYIEGFISIWLGEEYILEKNVLILLIIYQYISGSRGAVDAFNLAHGLYADTWAAWTELIINLVVTIVAGYYWGIVGLLLGKILSTITIIVFWKPYYLFKVGFKLKYRDYWAGATMNYLVSIVSFFSAQYLIKFMPYTTPDNYIEWAINAFLGTIIFICISCFFNYNFCRGGKDFALRIINLTKNGVK